MLENRWNQLARNTGGKAPEIDWVGVQREVELGLQRRLRRELQVDPLVICLVQPMPAGTPAYQGRAQAEPDSRPAPRVRRDGGRDAARDAGRDPAAGRPPAPVPVGARTVSTVQEPVQELEPAGRTRRRRSAAAS